MKNTNQTLYGCTMAVSYTAFVCWLFCMTQLEADYSRISISPLLLALFYMAVYLFDRFLAGKQAPLAVYVGFQFLLAAAAICLFLLTGTMAPFSMGIMIFMSIFLAAGVFGCGYAAEEPLGEKI